MHNPRCQRKLAASGFLAGVALLATASMAYACVQTIGRLQVTVPNGGGSSVAIGNGNHPGLGNNYCDPQPTNGARVLRATSFANRPSVTVSYGPASQCSPVGPSAVRPGRANTPTDGTYDVMFCDGQVFKQKGDFWVDISDPHAKSSCYFTDAVGDRAVLMGSMAVAGGSGSGSFQIPFGATKSGPNNAAGISVARTGPGPNPAGGPPDVNLAPITMI